MSKRVLFSIFITSITILLLSVSYFVTFQRTEAKNRVELNLIATLGSSDIATGSNRIIIGVLSPQRKTIQSKTISIDFFQKRDNSTIYRFSNNAEFINWPNSKSGIFSTNVNFDESGVWLAEISPKDGEYAGEKARIVLNVKEFSATPSVGDTIPETNNILATNSSELINITSDINPVLELYNQSINEIVTIKDKPLLILFATPGNCKSFTCGPQMNIVKSLNENYRKDMYFVHIEVYDMKSKKNDGQYIKFSPVIKPWNLPSEPWVFIINKDGIIIEKFESYVPEEELELLIQRAISDNSFQS